MSYSSSSYTISFGKQPTPSILEDIRLFLKMPDTLESIEMARRRFGIMYDASKEDDQVDTDSRDLTFEEWKRGVIDTCDNVEEILDYIEGWKVGDHDTDCLGYDTGGHIIFTTEDIENLQKWEKELKEQEESKIVCIYGTMTSKELKDEYDERCCFTACCIDCYKNNEHYKNRIEIVAKERNINLN